MDVSWAVHTITIAALALAACHKDSPSAPPVDPAYKTDISHLCDAEALSGADQQPEGARQLAIAEWLGPNIHTQDARNFLGSLTQIQGADKAKALRDEAAKVGLPGCALADTWK
jgi:hypothetical protein